MQFIKINFKIVIIVGKRFFVPSYERGFDKTLIEYNEYPSRYSLHLARLTKGIQHQ